MCILQGLWLLWAGSPWPQVLDCPSGKSRYTVGVIDTVDGDNFILWWHGKVRNKSKETDRLLEYMPPSRSSRKRGESWQWRTQAAIQLYGIIRLCPQILPSSIIFTLLRLGLNQLYFILEISNEKLLWNLKCRALLLLKMMRRKGVIDCCLLTVYSYLSKQSMDTNSIIPHFP